MTQDPQQHDSPRVGGQSPAAGVRAWATPGRASSPARTVASLHAAATFVARVGELDLRNAHDFIHAWHQTVAADAERWFEAESEVSAALVRSGRGIEQRALLPRLADAFSHGVWYRAGTASAAPPEARVRATEASGQYAATLAMIAVLVRDELDPRDFTLVYSPFATLIPEAELYDDLQPR